MTVRRRKTTDAQLTVPSTKISISLLQGVTGDTVEGATERQSKECEVQKTILKHITILVSTFSQTYTLQWPNLTTVSTPLIISYLKGALFGPLRSCLMQKHISALGSSTFPKTFKFG